MYAKFENSNFMLLFICSKFCNIPVIIDAISDEDHLSTTVSCTLGKNRQEVNVSNSFYRLVTGAEGTTLQKHGGYVTQDARQEDP